MRLSHKYIDTIKNTLQKFYPHEINIYLYDSRAKDDLAGGDIDLIWVVIPEFFNLLNEKKYRIIFDLQNKIGEQKIDLSIATQDLSEKDQFYSFVLKDAIKI